MWYIIIGVLTIVVIYIYKHKKKNLQISNLVHIKMKETKNNKGKIQSLSKLKHSFKPALNNNDALKKGKNIIDIFLINHYQSPDEMEMQFKQLNLPTELEKKEVALRKELNKYYKIRNDLKSKSFAIYGSA